MASSQRLAARLPNAEYLKKYVGGGNVIDLDPTQPKKVKRKKKKVTDGNTVAKVQPRGMKVMDADEERVVKNLFEDEDEELKPIIITEKEEPKAAAFKQTYIKVEDGSGWVTVADPVLVKKEPGDESPPRKRAGEDLSPPRGRARDEDQSPPRNRANDDSSPPRRRAADDDESPPRRRMDDQSPPRKVQIKKEVDADSSPPRRGAREDLSPPRRGGARDSSPPRRNTRDSSPPRRGAREDLSPPRKRAGADLSPPRNKRARDSSPPRRGARDSSPPRRGAREDLSPPRRGARDSSPPRRGARDSSPPRRGARDQSPPRRGAREDLSPPRKGARDQSPPRKTEGREVAPPSRMSSGALAGLHDASSVKKQAEEIAKHKQAMFAAVDAADLGKDAATVFRDRRGRRLEGLEEFKRQQDGKFTSTEEDNMVWGKGKVQHEKKVDMAQQLEEEKNKPFARTKDDEDMNDMLKDVDRWGDPMAGLVKKQPKKSKKSNKPAYQGPPGPPNRFGIAPGFRWDGVDRGSGFENQLFAMQAKRVAVKDEAYLWSVEDM